MSRSESRWRRRWRYAQRRRALRREVRDLTGGQVSNRWREIRWCTARLTNRQLAILVKRPSLISKAVDHMIAARDAAPPDIFETFDAQTKRLFG
ncbi:MAG: hypothetical protein OXU81_21875 [Gammaproteobacteria bacterium]|nr:hypothetical protein [Gammaproteobacteria bacterium]